MIKLKIKYGNSQTDLRFPCTEKEMNAALERIHAEDVTPLELYASEVVFPEELGFLQDRFANLDEVNYLAKRMDSFFGDEEYQFYEAMKLEGFDTLPDLINLSFNLNRYPLIQDIGDMGKIGREYLLTVNKAYLTERLEVDKNAKVRKLIKKDIEFLDTIQVEMATARQFFFVARIKGQKENFAFQANEK